MKPRPTKTPVKKVDPEDTFTIHMTDNARCMMRGGGSDTIYDNEFTGTLADCLRRCAAMMKGDAGEDLEYEDYLDPEEIKGYENMTPQEAKDSMDEADLGFGAPIVFWIKNSKGRKVYNSGLDESEWKEDDEDEDW